MVSRKVEYVEMSSHSFFDVDQIRELRPRVFLIKKSLMSF